MSKTKNSGKEDKPDTSRSNTGKNKKVDVDKEIVLKTAIKDKPKSLFIYDMGIPLKTKETLNSMDENQQKLKELIGKGIKIKKFKEFETKVEEVLGVEIDPIIEFFSHDYATTKDKFVLKFEDFIDLTQKWADSFIMQKGEEIQQVPVIDPNYEEKIDMQTRSRNTLMDKLDVHADKIREIFENFDENKDEPKNDKTNQEEPVPIIKLKNLPKILDDMSYLTGIVLMSYNEFLTDPKKKKSSQKAKEELVHYLWKQIHQEEVNELRRTRKNNSIYKQGGADDMRKSKQKDDKKPIEKPKKKKVTKKVRRKVPKKDGEGEESEEVEIEQSEEEDDANFDTYKGKYNLITFIEKVIAFEDEKYKQEKGESLLSYNLFNHYLEDFISSNSEFVLLDSNKPIPKPKVVNGDLKVSESQNPKVQQQIMDTICQYEELIGNDDFNSLEEKDATVKIVEQLYKQLREFEQRRTQSIKGSATQSQYNGLSKEELREKGLKEIFGFYCRQHIPNGIAFEELEIVMNQVDLGEFTAFCKDFEVPLPRIEVTRAYHQCSLNHKPLNFEQFYKAILRVGVVINNDKIKKLEQRLKLLPKDKVNKKSISKKTTKTLKSGSDSEDDEEGSESEGSDNDAKSKTSKTTKKSKVTKKSVKSAKSEKESDDESGSDAGSDAKTEKSKITKSKVSAKQEKSEKKAKKVKGSDSDESESDSEDEKSQAAKTEATVKMDENPALAEKDRVQEELDELKAKSSEDLFEEVLNFIECHDQAAYRKKIKGFRLAFNIRDKSYRIPENTLKKEMKFKSKQSAEEIKQKVKEMKDNRINMAKNKELMQKFKYDKNRKMIQKMHEKLRQEKHGGSAFDPHSSYFKNMIKNKSQRLGNVESKHAPVNLDVLKKMHYSDFNLGDDDDFKPTDIIDEDDDSDDSILEQYKASQDPEIALPQENILLNNNQQNQYNEKVVSIKHHLNKNDLTREQKNHYLNDKSQDKSKMKNKDLSMLGRYRVGRNVSQVNSK